MKNSRPVIGITMGDPFGVGPEIAVKSLADKSVYSMCKPLLIGDANVFQNVVTLTGLELKIQSVRSEAEADFKSGQIDVLQPPECLVRELRYGTVSAVAGHAAFIAIEKAIELAKSEKIAAAVTGPINKEAINAAGHNFPGHTEIFARYTETEDYAMLLVYGDLRVIHVTTHIPFKLVAGMITKGRVLKVIELAHETCLKLGIKQPRIGVAGLNPHAGDGGLFGTEEQEHIAPAIEDARSAGIDAEGPVPPDTLFPKAISGLFDICVAMYHDQGHIPLKLTGFIWDRENKRWRSVNGVNITLGLPIIRTSVDHGTAFDIAGKGIASPDSMINAIEYAVKLASSSSI
ncbi:MAG: 4-hydroxythreonine-4-phosphate dehydrogenase PdxA [Sedimentisphaerales bacterium]|nr:4-hydroxythreonine-4-phosphate dehydrogenase PdxA [Sedimentisphaerales bacterium]